MQEVSSRQLSNANSPAVIHPEDLRRLVHSAADHRLNSDPYQTLQISRQPFAHSSPSASIVVAPSTPSATAHAGPTPHTPSPQSIAQLPGHSYLPQFLSLRHSMTRDLPQLPHDAATHPRRSGSSSLRRDWRHRDSPDAHSHHRRSRRSRDDDAASLTVLARHSYPVAGPQYAHADHASWIRHLSLQMLQQQQLQPPVPPRDHGDMMQQQHQPGLFEDDPESSYWTRRLMRATRPTVRLVSLPLRYDKRPVYFDEVMPDELQGRISNLTFAVRMQELNRRLSALLSVADLGPMMRLAAMLFAFVAVVGLILIMFFNFTSIWSLGIVTVFLLLGFLFFIIAYRVKAAEVVAKLTTQWTKEDRPVCRLRWTSIRGEVRRVAWVKPIRVPWEIAVDLVDLDGDGVTDDEDDDDPIDLAAAPVGWQQLMDLDPASRAAALLQVMDQGLDPLPRYTQEPVYTKEPEPFWADEDVAADRAPPGLRSNDDFAAPSARAASPATAVIGAIPGAAGGLPNLDPPTASAAPATSGADSIVIESAAWISPYDLLNPIALSDDDEDTASDGDQPRGSRPRARARRAARRARAARSASQRAAGRLSALRSSLVSAASFPAVQPAAGGTATVRTRSFRRAAAASPIPSTAAAAASSSSSSAGTRSAGATRSAVRTATAAAAAAEASSRRPLSLVGLDAPFLRRGAATARPSSLPPPARHRPASFVPLAAPAGTASPSPAPDADGVAPAAISSAASVASVASSSTAVTVAATVQSRTQQQQQQRSGSGSRQDSVQAAGPSSAAASAAPSPVPPPPQQPQQQQQQQEKSPYRLQQRQPMPSAAAASSAAATTKASTAGARSSESPATAAGANTSDTIGVTSLTSSSPVIRHPTDSAAE
ncbi:hypothetical protein HK405_003419 [Cladochytrium tenue]|nr:hypothetical protein HK405_003419 [Cladochytrium tenue]